MNKRMTIASCALVLGCPAVPRVAVADTPQKAHVEVPRIAARPSDVGTVESIVKADYECISGGVGVPRQWARDFTLYDPNARSFTPSRDDKGVLTVWSPTQQEYADEADAHFVKEGFVEHELAHKIYRFGNVATVFSSYEGKMSTTGATYSRGVNIYQLYYDGKRWWISSVSWDGASYVNDIPAELLPKSPKAEH